MAQKQENFTIWYFLMIMLILMLMETFFITPQVDKISYSQFKSLVSRGLSQNWSLNRTLSAATSKPRE